MSVFGSTNSEYYLLPIVGSIWGGALIIKSAIDKNQIQYSRYTPLKQ